MPLYQPIGPELYEDTHKDILARVESFYADAITHNQAFWTEADNDTRFYSGDQTLWNDIYFGGNVPVNRRKQFNFNRIMRVVNMISGYQRRNRKSTIAVPVENGDERTASQYTKILMWLNQQEGVLETISESFQGSLITGMNLLQVWVDYRSDPVAGNIKVDNCAYNSFIIDPFFRKADLSDCSGIWKRSYLSRMECSSLLPDKTNEILALAGVDNRDGKFQFLPETYNYRMRHLLTYDEFYYKDYRKQKMLVDTQTGESMEWTSDNDEGLKQFLSQYPQVTLMDQEVPTVRVAIIVQGKVMYDGPNPLGIDNYPFVPVFSYYTPDLPYFPWRVQGVVRGLRDAQYLYNRRKAIELDILESQVNSGFKYKENALVNPLDVFMTGQGKGIALKEEAAMTDVEQIIPPSVPPSMIELSEILGKEIEAISGVNEELLGSAIDDKAGILSMLRQGAGLTTLQGLFDNLDRAQRLLGRLLLDVISSNFTPGKVQRIVQEQPSPQFYNKAFGKYDVSVEEGLNTTTQRQMEFAQLLQLREAGVPVPNDVLLGVASLQDKEKLIASVQNVEQQQSQMQQFQLQAMLKEQEAKTELAHARAVADQGLGMERLSRIQENKALADERKAAAIKDEEIAALNMIKGMKELDGVDIDHIHKAMTILQMMKQRENDIPNDKQSSLPEAPSVKGTLRSEKPTPMKAARKMQKAKGPVK